MGCGKTTVGRVLADLLGTAYADMDAIIGMYKALNPKVNTLLDA